MKLLPNKPWLRLAAALAILAAFLLAWYLISPVFIDVQVDEDFPRSEEATQAMSEAIAAEAILVNEAMPENSGADMTILLAGEFYDIAHEGVGTATIYQLADGSRILRFENFEVSNGPQLHVYLATEDPVPLRVVGGLGGRDLGSLKGNIGDQNYTIPDDLDLSIYHSVLIYCVPFQKAFNAAALASPD